MEITDIGKSSGEVYHYTSLAAALNIITPKGLKFHASRYDNMEDAYDSEYAFAVSQEILQKNGIDHIGMDYYKCRPYVLSFCKKKDNFSMGRLYNAEVILHIDSEKLLQDASSKSQLVMANDVQYLSASKATSYVLDAFKSHYFGENEEFELMTNAKCSFLKHPDYSIEEEWRLSYFEVYNIFDGRHPDSLHEDKLASEVLFKIVKGTPRIYRELTFDKKCLKDITLVQHGVHEIKKTQVTLSTWLAKCGYKHDEIGIYITKTPLTNK